MNVYYYVAWAAFPDFRVATAFFYTADGNRIEIDSLPKNETADLINRDYAEAQSDGEEDPIIR